MAGAMNSRHAKFAIKVASAAGKSKMNVTLNDLDKSPEEVLQEIKAETIEELEEAAWVVNILLNTAWKKFQL